MKPIAEVAVCRPHGCHGLSPRVRPVEAICRKLWGGGGHLLPLAPRVQPGPGRTAPSATARPSPRAGGAGPAPGRAGRSASAPGRRAGQASVASPGSSGTGSPPGERLPARDRRRHVAGVDLDPDAAAPVRSQAISVVPAQNGSRTVAPGLLWRTRMAPLTRPRRRRRWTPCSGTASSACTICSAGWRSRSPRTSPPFIARVDTTPPEVPPHARG